jgi:hypothetical protein
MESNLLPLLSLQRNEVEKLKLICNRIVTSFRSHSNAAQNVGNEGVIILAEALKSNTSLTSLYLTSTKFVTSFILTHYR